MELYSRYRLKPRQLLGGTPIGNTQRTSSMFIAYRFKDGESQAFRRKLEVDMHNSDALCEVGVTDGHALPGQPWLRVIRERIEKCNLVVADMTNLSPEVLFETGLAWGKNKPIIPVVDSKAVLKQLPHWLTDFQIASFGTSQGLSDILDSINKRLFLKEKTLKVTTHPKPVPGRVTWLRGVPEFQCHRDSLTMMATRYGLTLVEDENLPTGLDSTDESLMNEVCRASLVVASLTLSPSASFTHFAAGTVVSTPTAGMTTEKLRRCMILAVPDTLNITDVLSDSASRCDRIIRAVRLQNLSQEFLNWGKAYKQYKEKISTPYGQKNNEN